MKALIAEDHLLSSQLLKGLLGPFFDCDVAANGQEAIDSFLVGHEAKSPYHVIFLDIMMPGVDGLMALQYIRAMEQAMKIPHDLGVKVIMTTALDDVVTVMKSFGECRADSYIIKPLSKQKLLQELQILKLVP